MKPSQFQSPTVLRQGNRRLMYWYMLLALLVIALVSFVLAGFYKQQRVKQLNTVIGELSGADAHIEQVDHAVQTMYDAENHFRFFTLTYRNSYFKQYSDDLQTVSNDLDSLEQIEKKEDGAHQLLQEKREKSDIFLKVKRATDSLLTMNKAWDTTKERDIFQPVSHITFKKKVTVDTVSQGPAQAEPVKKKKLFGRLADAFSSKNKKTEADQQSPKVVKTSISIDSSRQGLQYNRKQLSQIHDYYNKLFKKIASGHANLNQREYEMITANDRLLKALLVDLQSLKRERLEAAAQLRLSLNQDIHTLLGKLDRETSFGALLILLLAIIILLFIWYSYRNDLKLNRARNKALQYSKLKSDFVAGMSHEIRTPLNSVIGYSEQLGKTRLNNEQEEILDAINLSANMLLSVVNNVLDFSKLEEDRLRLEHSTFAPRRIIEETTKGLQIQAFRKNLQLVSNIGFKNDVVVEGDPFRLKQILVNLIGNAIKFTASGSVTVQADVQQSDGRVILKVAVTDTGIGIDQKHLRHIFDEFTQVSSHRDSLTREEGTGLGLAIVKKLIDLHGGELEVESTPEKGSAFRFRIPYYTVANDPAAREPEIASRAIPHSTRILLVDDNNLNRRLLEMILQGLHASFLSATNGKEALHLLKENKVDIILTDIQMPEMDGLTLTRHIRRMEDPEKARVPIIAITGNVVKEELDTYLQAGINGYVLKPFKEKEVLNKIRECLNAGRTLEHNNH